MMVLTVESKVYDESIDEMVPVEINFIPTSSGVCVLSVTLASNGTDITQELTSRQLSDAEQVAYDDYYRPPTPEDRADALRER